MMGFAPNSRIAAQANVSEANVKARSAGRRHNPRIIESRLQGYLL
jgi:hypothetical protein